MRGGEPLPPVLVRVQSPPEIRVAETHARRAAEALGFPARACDEISLVVAELGSNLLRHATGGELRLELAEAGGRKGLRVESLDRGPGFADFERATADGYSTAGSLGTGLGTVNRLMDELHYHPLPSGGSRIVCCRWLRAQPGVTESRFDIGVASRSYRQLAENGDAFVIREGDQMALAAVIDGLGHGKFAQRAAQAARQYVDQHWDQPLEAIFRGVERTCQATRGVVMAIVRFDLKRQTLAYANIGNVEVRVRGGGQPVRFIVRRGVVGQRAPLPKIQEHPWTAGMTLVMHSDGVPSHWSWSDFPQLWAEPSSRAAQRLLSALGRADDDATVVVVRTARP